MKILKFAPELVPLILSGEKRSTWRLFDDKDLASGDDLSLVDKVTGEEIAKARITNLYTKKLNEIDESDYDSHERYSSLGDMLQAFRKYYGYKVTPETEVKILKFELV